MEMPWNEHYATRTRRMTSSAIRALLKVTEQSGFISFAGGLPAPEIFPTEEVAEVAGRVLRESGSVALQYSATEGYRPLRELIARRMTGEGVPTTVDNVLITTGSQQAIDLVGKVLIDPGDAVVVESPTYLAALQSWNAYEADFVSVPSDDDGMEVDRLEEIAHLRPKLIYSLPNFQNPSGVTLSESRRRQLVDVSTRHQIAVIEDDPYHDLRFEGEPLSRLIALQAAQSPATDSYRGSIITLSTFSKILAPGLRVGWVVADAEMIAQLTQAKQGTDLHTSTLDQMIAYEMLRSGYLEGHTRLIVQTYRERRDAMLRALVEHFPPEARWTRPAGGMFLWITLPSTIDTTLLLQAAMEQRVAFVPGQGFHPDGRGHNTMRLNFSNSSPEQIYEGIHRLAQALETLQSTANTAQPLGVS